MMCQNIRYRFLIHFRDHSGALFNIGEILIFNMGLQNFFILPPSDT